MTGTTPRLTAVALLTAAIAEDAPTVRALIVDTLTGEEGDTAEVILALSEMAAAMAEMLEWFGIPEVASHIATAAMKLDNGETVASDG